MAFCQPNLLLGGLRSDRVPNVYPLASCGASRQGVLLLTGLFDGGGLPYSPFLIWLGAHDKDEG